MAICAYCGIDSIGVLDWFFGRRVCRSSCAKEGDMVRVESFKGYPQFLDYFKYEGRVGVVMKRELEGDEFGWSIRYIVKMDDGVEIGLNCLHFKRIR